MARNSSPAEIGKAGDFISRSTQTIGVAVRAPCRQSRSDGVKTVMIARLGLGAADFVEGPVLFTRNADAGGPLHASAGVPDMVNLLVANGRLVVPDPFFDPFGADFDDRLSALGYWKSSAAASSHFIDTFIRHHNWQGQGHCGTDRRREIAASTGWWTQTLRSAAMSLSP